MKPVFIDIGAHQGLETAWALDHDYDVYAFEPNPYWAQHLSHYQASAYICYAAAWSEDGFMTLYSGADENQHGASLYREKTTIRADLRIKVQTVNIGKFLDRLNRDIAILKINAEGAEYEILHSIWYHVGFRSINKIWVEDHAEK